MFKRFCLYKVRKYLKIILTILFVINILPLYSFDYTDFILNSNRNINMQIFKMIIEEDLDNSLQLIKLLGLRDDPYVEDIIYNILLYRENNINYELLLENLLFNVIQKNSEQLLFWMQTNKYAYFELIKQMYSFENTYLKCQIYDSRF